jgi:hypothetical protein
MQWKKIGVSSKWKTGEPGEHRCAQTFDKRDTVRKCLGLLLPSSLPQLHLATSFEHLKAIQRVTMSYNTALSLTAFTAQLGMRHLLRISPYDIRPDTECDGQIARPVRSSYYQHLPISGINSLTQSHTLTSLVTTIVRVEWQHSTSKSFGYLFRLKRNVLLCNQAVIPLVTEMSRKPVLQHLAPSFALSQKLDNSLSKVPADMADSEKPRLLDEIDYFCWEKPSLAPWFPLIVDLGKA